MAHQLTLHWDSSEKLKYIEPGIPVRVVKGNLVSLEGLRARCHWHQDLEFLLPVRGYLSYQVNDREYRVEEGQGIFVNSRRMHYGYSADGTDCVYICIVIHPALLAGNELLYSRYFAPAMDDTAPDAIILRPENEEHRAILDALLEVYSLCLDNGEPGFELLVLSRMQAVWQKLLKLLKGSPAGGQDSADMKKMLSYLYENLSQKITLEDLARVGGVSRTKCCQMFHTYFGRAPIDYLISYRLDISMELLRTTEDPVIDIAAKCGFSSPSYFAELFRARIGCSPKEYRVRKQSAEP